MKGYVHRLITIGTPHFGAPLSKILHGFQDEKYCYDRSTHIFTSIVCIPNAFPEHGTRSSSTLKLLTHPSINFRYKGG